MNLAPSIIAFTREFNFVRTHSVLFGKETAPVFSMGNEEPRSFMRRGTDKRYFHVFSHIHNAEKTYSAAHYRKWTKDFGIFEAFTYEEFQKFVVQHAHKVRREGLV